MIFQSEKKAWVSEKETQAFFVAYFTVLTVAGGK